jgi:predicted RND superfamily exporter protein
VLQIYAKWLLRYSWLVVCLTVLFAVAAGAGIKNIHFKSDNRMFFNQEDPLLISFNALEKTYSKNDNVLVVLSPKNGDVFTAEYLAIAEKLTHDLWQTPFSTRVDSITNFQYSFANGDDLEVKDLVRHAGQLSPPEIANLRQIALNEPLIVNRLLAPDARVIGFYVLVDRPGKNQEAETAKTAEFIRKLSTRYEAEYPAIKIHLTGTVITDAAFAEESRSDLLTLTPAMLLIITIALQLLLKSVSGTFAALLMMALSIIAAVGCAGWMNIAFSPSSVPAPTILLTLALADAVHIVTSYYIALGKGSSKKESIKESLLINFKAIFFTNLTTAIGFLSMNFSDSPPFHDLGNITAMGVGATYLLTITFLPALLVLLPAHNVYSTRQDGVFIQTLANFVIKYRKSLYLFLLLSTALLIGCIPLNKFEDDFVKYFDKSVQFRRDTDYTSQHLTGIYSIDYSLIQGEEGGINDPRFLAEVDAFVRWYRQQPEVIHVFSLTDILKRLNKNMQGDNPASYQLPETRELSAQYLLMYEMSLPFGLDLNDRINVNKSSTRITVTLRNLSTQQFIDLEARAQAWLTNNTSRLKNSKGTGATLLFAHISERNNKSMISGEIVSMALISLILMFVLKSIGLGLISLIPNLVPAGMAFGIWGLVVGQIGMSCSVVAAMTLGILVDDTVHFLSKYQYARKIKSLSPEKSLHFAFATVGKALWVTSAVLILGFSLFAFSSFKINYEMGLLTATIFALGLFAEFVLLPPILLAFENSVEWFRLLFHKR